MTAPDRSASAGTIVFVTHLLDADHPGLGFVIPQVDALRRRFDRVIVIANDVGRVPADFTPDVISLGKERGAHRLRRVLRYQAALVRSLRHRPVTLFVHMSPAYVTSAAAVTTLFRTPTLLWYAHPSDSPRLHRAERLADAVLTTQLDTFPHASTKLHAVGQAIDVDRFADTPPPASAPRRLVALGRTSPSKNYALMVQGLRRAVDAGADLTLSIVGPSTTDEERAHRVTLDALVDTLGLADRVDIREGIAHQDVPAELERAAALVNLMTAGAGDKAVFEAMAAGRPVVVGPGIFADMVRDASLPLACENDEVSVSRSLVAIAAASAEELASVGAHLRAMVVRSHSLESWVDSVAEIALSLRRPPAQARR